MVDSREFNLRPARQCIDAGPVKRALCSIALTTASRGHDWPRIPMGERCTAMADRETSPTVIEVRSELRSVGSRS